MKNFIYLALIVLAMGCQSESLDIRANYRIKLQASSPGATLKVHQPYALPLELLTDSYYSEYGYQLQFYQQTGLGRLDKGTDAQTVPVFQKVGVALPLGVSSWQYTPEAVGTSQIVLVAQQERGYIQPDTLRLNFQIIP
ncbi:hypothetical protein [Spirosoma aerophilum]